MMLLLHLTIEIFVYSANKNSREKSTLSFSPNVNKLFVRVFPVMIDIGNVVVVLKMLKEKVHVLDIIFTFESYIV